METPPQNRNDPVCDRADTEVRPYDGGAISVRDPRVGAHGMRPFRP